MKYPRLIIIFLVILILSGLLHFYQYNWQNSQFYAVITTATASNALFVVGILVFLPAFVAATGAFSVFFGIRYAFGILFSSKFKEKHPHYRDYIATKNTEIKTTFFNELLLASAIVLTTGIILAFV